MTISRIMAIFFAFWAGAAVAIDGIQVTSISTSRFAGNATDPLAGACAQWTLTSEEAEQFLGLAIEVEPEDRYRLYYWVPCSVSGRGRLGGQAMSFEINAAATAEVKLQNGGTLYLGCPSAGCEPLVLMQGGVPERDFAP